MWKATSRTCLTPPARRGRARQQARPAAPRQRTFRTTGAPLPRQPAGYQELQNALRTGTRLAW